MRIYDKKVIQSSFGVEARATVIRYYLKNNSEDYILTCDLNKSIIIWEIQNNFNKKYKLSQNYSGFIWDALLLFNINNKNYILLSSSGDEGEDYSKLYELNNNNDNKIDNNNNNLKFIKDINNTNQNCTYYMIQWIYNNKLYLIECCFGKISINNVFENEKLCNFSL